MSPKQKLSPFKRPSRTSLALKKLRNERRSSARNFNDGREVSWKKKATFPQRMILKAITKRESFIKNTLHFKVKFRFKTKMEHSRLLLLKSQLFRIIILLILHQQHPD